MNDHMMDDRELEKLAKRLGARAEQGVDVERVAERVVERLRGEEYGPVIGSHPWYAARPIRRMFQLAATVVVLITGGLLVRTLVVPTNPTAEFAVPLALDDLSESELTDVLDSLEFAGPVRQVGTVGLDDLSDAELEELLAMME